MLRLNLTVLALALVASSVSLSPAVADAAGVAAAGAAQIEVCFVPLGKQDTRLLSLALRGSAYLYGATTRQLPRRPLPTEAYYAPRGRYRADKILDYLDSQAKSLPEGARCDVMVGITTVDISTTKGEHKDWGVLGLGTIGGQSAVVSSFRMRKRATMRQRSKRMVSTVNHEIGHVLGAPHGGAPGCLMNDAKGTVKTIDDEHGLLCEESRAIIEAHSGHPLPKIAAFDWTAILHR